MAFLRNILIFFVSISSMGVSTGGKPAAVMDGRGRAVRLNQAPHRIASSCLAADEILVALLGRAKRLDDLIAVSALADDARYSNIVPMTTTIKGRVGSDLEATLALAPDLIVLASFNKPEILKRLGDAGRSTFVLADFSALQDIAQNIRRLGQLVWAAKEGEDLAREFETSLATLQQQGTQLKAKPKVIAYYSDGAVHGSQTIVDDMIRVAGGENLAATIGLKGWPKLGAETLLTLKPDMLVTGGRPDDPQETTRLLNELKQKPGWRDLDAVKKGRLLVISDRDLNSTSQHVLKAVQQLQLGLSAGRP